MTTREKEELRSTFQSQKDAPGASTIRFGDWRDIHSHAELEA
jgi:hypothetical protein